MKRVLTLILSFALMLSSIPSVLAASDEAISAANSLHELGLFNGTDTDNNGNPNFDLDRAPTRNEAVTMLVRILGKEDFAKTKSWVTPFTDVPEWAKSYVGYAYASGLADGTNSTVFNGNGTVTASQYLTFVLRALGYKSGTDFQWDKAWELSDKIGLTHGQYSKTTSTFTRGDVAIISKQALTLTNSTEKPSVSIDALQGAWKKDEKDTTPFRYDTEIFIDGNTYTEVSFTNGERGFGYTEATYETGPLKISGSTVNIEIDYYRGFDYNPEKSSVDIDHVEENLSRLWTDTAVISDTLCFKLNLRDANGPLILDYSFLKSTDAPLYKEYKPKVAKFQETLNANKPLDATEYIYLAGNDFRRIHREYSTATAQYAYVTAYKNENEDLCILTDVWYKIKNTYHEVTLHIIPTGETIIDPSSYYKKLADRQYGLMRLKYMDLQLEVLKHLSTIKSDGIYVSGDTLNQ
ncbi:MAG: S-layer homology domain-containing protein [Ruminiclostridium sp.]|jgi:hypothetical protein|nr:S-layer homology domain-containing protein [Ruminiclostridium sp.]